MALFHKGDHVPHVAIYTNLLSACCIQEYQVCMPWYTIETNCKNKEI